MAATVPTFSNPDGTPDLSANDGARLLASFGDTAAFDWHNTVRAWHPSAPTTVPLYRPFTGDPVDYALSHRSV